MEAVTLVHAHPYPSRSIACRALADAAASLPDVDVRPLYSLYPDFEIDVAVERSALERSGLLVFLHPLYWYSMPGMLKHYFDVVFTKGWAYGGSGGALAGKSCLWAVTTGGDAQAFTPSGRHHHPLADFTPPLEETMRYCGLRWLEPFVVLGAHDLPAGGIEESAAQFRARLVRWREAPR